MDFLGAFSIKEKILLLILNTDWNKFYKFMWTTFNSKSYRDFVKESLVPLLCVVSSEMFF